MSHPTRAAARPGLVAQPGDTPGAAVSPLGLGVWPPPGSVAAPQAPARGGHRGPARLSLAQAPQPPRAWAPLCPQPETPFSCPWGCGGGWQEKPSCPGGLFITRCQRGRLDRPTVSPCAPRAPCHPRQPHPNPIPVTIPILPIPLPDPVLLPMHQDPSWRPLHRRQSPKSCPGDIIPLPTSTRARPAPHSPSHAVSLQTHPGPRGLVRCAGNVPQGQIQLLLTPQEPFAPSSPGKTRRGKLRHGAGRARRALRRVQPAVFTVMGG